MQGGLVIMCNVLGSPTSFAHVMSHNWHMRPESWSWITGVGQCGRLLQSGTCLVIVSILVANYCRLDCPLALKFIMWATDTWHIPDCNGYLASIIWKLFSKFVDISVKRVIFCFISSVWIWWSGRLIGCYQTWWWYASLPVKSGGQRCTERGFLVHFPPRVTIVVSWNWWTSPH